MSGIDNPLLPLLNIIDFADLVVATGGMDIPFELLLPLLDAFLDGVASEVADLSIVLPLFPVEDGSADLLGLDLSALGS